MRSRLLVVVAVVGLAGCGGSGTGPDSTLDLAGNYTLELRSSSSCASFSGQTWSWPVVVTSGPYTSGGRMATIASADMPAALNAYLLYDYEPKPKDTTGSVLTHDPLPLGGNRWLVTSLSVNGTLAVTSGRWSMNDGFGQGELRIGSTADRLRFTAENVCPAADHRVSLRPR
jgi:hypothetical protein